MVMTLAWFVLASCVATLSSAPGPATIRCYAATSPGPAACWSAPPPGSQALWHHELPETIGGPDFQHRPRWTQTASTPGPLAQGDPTVITYSFVADGTAIEGVPAGTGCTGIPATIGSNLFATFDGLFGSTMTWQAIIHDAFQSWEGLSGIDFVYLAADDGATIANSCTINGNPLALSPGLAGARADIRIGGRDIDGQPAGPNRYAIAYFPDHGDILLDTSNTTFFGDTGNDYRNLRNVIAHEIGHAIGLDHVCPINQSKLMESSFSGVFLGPQFDDVLGAQRHYGDRYEHNDSLATSTQLGTLPAGVATLTGVSTDSLSDQDHFTFSLSSATSISVAVTPQGQAYAQGAETGGICGAALSQDARSFHDLELQVFNASGQLIASSTSQGLGAVEVVSGLLVAAGAPVTIRVFVDAAAANNASSPQAYKLEIGSIVTVIGPTPVSAPPWIVDDSAPSGGNGTPLAPFQSIPEAIAAASHGDLILVAPGNYLPFDFVGKSVTVASMLGPGTTAIAVGGVLFQPLVSFASGETSGAGIHGFHLLSLCLLPCSFPVIRCSGSSPVISNCSFNASNIGGPAILCENGAAPVIMNCHLYGSGQAGVQASTGATPLVVNCTIRGNALTNAGAGGLLVGGGSFAGVLNSILWDNPPQTSQAPQIVVQPGGAVSVAYSLVGGPTVWPGTGNINSDPGPLGAFAAISASSPAVNAGTVALPTARIPSVDIEGKFRFHGPIDMGANEFVDACGISPIIVCGPGGTGGGSPVHTYPGTGEAFEAFSLVGSTSAPLLDIKSALPGQTVVLGYTASPGPLTLAPFLMGVQAYPVGSPPPLLPVPGYPSIHLDPATVVFLIQDQIGTTGRTLAIPYPGGLIGYVGRAQGFIFSPSAANGLFAATSAFEIVFL